MDIETKIEEITPIIAKNLLAKNPNNRKLNENWALRLAVDIDEGKWALNGETIIIDTDGNVLDGQHRLRAVVIADKSIMVNVARNVLAETKTTIDIGKSRTLADILTLSGNKNHASFRGSVVKAIITEACGSMHSINRLTIPKQEKIHNILNENFSEQMLFGATRRRIGCVPYAYVSAFYTMLAITNEYSAQEFELFFDKWSFPDNAAQKTPEYALRHFFLKEGEVNRGGGSNTVARRRHAIWRAWQSSQEKAQVESIKIENEYIFKPIALVDYENPLIQKIKSIVREG